VINPPTKEPTSHVIIEKHEELEAYFKPAGKPRTAGAVGTEYEKVASIATPVRLFPYFGPWSVDRILREMIERTAGSRRSKTGNIIALSRDSHADHPRPGGQIELSGEPCETFTAPMPIQPHIREL
jgi:gamma-glutamylcysteine synthetase